LANGDATSRIITGADGKVFILSGGSSNISAESVQVVGATNTLFAWIPPIPGAVAYAWFVGTTSNAETLQLITTTANMALSVPLVASGRQSQTAITVDNSTNPNYAYDGLLSNAFNPANGAIVTSLAQASGTGLPGVLTSSGRGSVLEIDTILEQMWDQFNLGPTVWYVSAQEQRNISNKVLSNTSGPLLRYDSGATPGGPYAIVAGGVIDYYYNPFSHEGGYKMPVKIHPDLPPGTMMGWCERLPPWYQSNEVPNVAEMKLRRDYYRIDWPLMTRQREYGVYCEEVLAIYAPFAMCILNNVGNG
jgi:hypothetical protein